MDGCLNGWMNCKRFFFCRDVRERGAKSIVVNVARHNASFALRCLFRVMCDVCMPCMVLCGHDVYAERECEGAAYGVYAINKIHNMNLRVASVRADNSIMLLCIGATMPRLLCVGFGWQGLTAQRYIIVFTLSSPSVFSSDFISEPFSCALSH